MYVSELKKLIINPTVDSDYQQQQPHYFDTNNVTLDAQLVNCESYSNVASDLNRILDCKKSLFKKQITKLGKNSNCTRNNTKTRFINSVKIDLTQSDMVTIDYYEYKVEENDDRITIQPTSAKRYRHLKNSDDYSKELLVHIVSCKPKVYKQEIEFELNNSSQSGYHTNGVNHYNTKPLNGLGHNGADVKYAYEEIPITIHLKNNLFDIVPKKQPQQIAVTNYVPQTRKYEIDLTESQLNGYFNGRDRSKSRDSTKRSVHYEEEPRVDVYETIVHEIIETRTELRSNENKPGIHLVNLESELVPLKKINTVSESDSVFDELPDQSAEQTDIQEDKSENLIATDHKIDVSDFIIVPYVHEEQVENEETQILTENTDSEVDAVALSENVEEPNQAIEELVKPNKTDFVFSDEELFLRNEAPFKRSKIALPNIDSIDIETPDAEIESNEQYDQYDNIEPSEHYDNIEEPKPESHSIQSEILPTITQETTQNIVFDVKIQDVSVDDDTQIPPSADTTSIISQHILNTIGNNDLNLSQTDVEGSSKDDESISEQYDNIQLKTIDTIEEEQASTSTEVEELDRGVPVEVENEIIEDEIEMVQDDELPNEDVPCYVDQETVERDSENASVEQSTNNADSNISVDKVVSVNTEHDLNESIGIKEEAVQISEEPNKAFELIAHDSENAEPDTIKSSSKECTEKVEPNEPEQDQIGDTNAEAVQISENSNQEVEEAKSPEVIEHDLESIVLDTFKSDSCACRENVEPNETKNELEQNLNMQNENNETNHISEESNHEIEEAKSSKVFEENTDKADSNECDEVVKPNQPDPVAGLEEDRNIQNENSEANLEAVPIFQEPNQGVKELNNVEKQETDVTLSKSVASVNESSDESQEPEEKREEQVVEDRYEEIEGQVLQNVLDTDSEKIETETEVKQKPHEQENIGDSEEIIKLTVIESTRGLDAVESEPFAVLNNTEDFENAALDAEEDELEMMLGQQVTITEIDDIDVEPGHSDDSLLKEAEAAEEFLDTQNYDEAETVNKDNNEELIEVEDENCQVAQENTDLAEKESVIHENINDAETVLEEPQATIITDKNEDETMAEIKESENAATSESLGKNKKKKRKNKNKKVDSQINIDEKKEESSAVGVNLGLANAASVIESTEKDGVEDIRTSDVVENVSNEPKPLSYEEKIEANASNVQIEPTTNEQIVETFLESHSASEDVVQINSYLDKAAKKKLKKKASKAKLKLKKANTHSKPDELIQEETKEEEECLETIEPVEYEDLTAHLKEDEAQNVKTELLSEQPDECIQIIAPQELTVELINEQVDEEACQISTEAQESLTEKVDVVLESSETNGEILEEYANEQRVDLPQEQSTEDEPICLNNENLKAESFDILNLKSELSETIEPANLCSEVAKTIVEKPEEQNEKVCLKNETEKAKILDDLNLKPDLSEPFGVKSDEAEVFQQPQEQIVELSNEQNEESDAIAYLDNRLVETKSESVDENIKKSWNISKYESVSSIHDDFGEERDRSDESFNENANSDEKLTIGRSMEYFTDSSVFLKPDEDEVQKVENVKEFNIYDYFDDEYEDDMEIKLEQNIDSEFTNELGSLDAGMPLLKQESGIDDVFSQYRQDTIDFLPTFEEGSTVENLDHLVIEEEKPRVKRISREEVQLESIQELIDEEIAEPHHDDGDVEPNEEILEAVSVHLQVNSAQDDTQEKVESQKSETDSLCENVAQLSSNTDNTSQVMSKDLYDQDEQQKNADDTLHEINDETGDVEDTSEQLESSNADTVVNRSVVHEEFNEIEEPQETMQECSSEQVEELVAGELKNPEEFGNSLRQQQTPESIPDSQTDESENRVSDPSNEHESEESEEMKDNKSDGDRVVNDDCNPKEATVIDGLDPKGFLLAKKAESSSDSNGKRTDTKQHKKKKTKVPKLRPLKIKDGKAIVQQKPVTKPVEHPATKPATNEPFGYNSVWGKELYSEIVTRQPSNRGSRSDTRSALNSTSSHKDVNQTFSIYSNIDDDADVFLAKSSSQKSFESPIQVTEEQHDEPSTSNVQKTPTVIIINEELDRNNQNIIINAYTPEELKKEGTLLKYASTENLLKDSQMQSSDTSKKMLYSQILASSTSSVNLSTAGLEATTQNSRARVLSNSSISLSNLEKPNEQKNPVGQSNQSKRNNNNNNNKSRTYTKKKNTVRKP